MPYTKRYSRMPTGSALLLGQLRQRKLKPTKSNYVLMLILHNPELDFPLDPDLIAEIPEWLEGKMPDSWSDVYVPIHI